ncbi:MAG TPA: hypothetical protein VIO13_03360 [Candidatus Dormibacteraeota bacterium]
MWLDGSHAAHCATNPRADRRPDSTGNNRPNGHANPNADTHRYPNPYVRTAYARSHGNV